MQGVILNITGKLYKEKISKKFSEERNFMKKKF